MSEIEYNNLLFEISEKLDGNQLPRLVFMCRNKIAKGSEENIGDVLALFKQLEKHNSLGIDRLDTLKEILSEMKKRPLLKKVEKFEIKRKGIPLEFDVLCRYNRTLGLIHTCKFVMPEVS